MKKLIYTLLIVFASAVLNAQNLDDGQMGKTIEDRGWPNIYPPALENGGPDGSGNGVVGAIGGTVNVSALGGATYTIPIQVPDGINGMQPNLSVVYNNQSGNGLLGWNWNLGGISAITRVGTTMYHNQFVYPVDFEHDRFALDGQWLMAVSGTYGANGTEYKTELDGLTKIVSYKSAVDTTNGPAWFKVFTADGLIMEYGNSWDSRIGLQQHNDACFWLLNRVEDRNGNYMTYHYCRGGANYYLSYISYGGRSDSSQCYSVHFDYDNDRLDVETSFIGNNTLRQVSLLKKITVKHWENEMERYDFVYDSLCHKIDSLTDFNRIYNRLVQIDYSCGGVSYNPTKIHWVKYPDSNREVCQNEDEMRDYKLYQVQDVHGNLMQFILNQCKYAGDFNGDGYTDFAYFSTDSKSDELREDEELNKEANLSVFINAGTGINSQGTNILYFKELELPLERVSLDVKIYICDFDGDGMDDIIYFDNDYKVSYDFENWNGFGSPEPTYYHGIRLFAYKSVKNENGDICFEQVPIHGDVGWNDGFFTASNGAFDFVTGNFVGNGKHDFFLHKRTWNHDVQYPYERDSSFYFTYSNGEIMYCYIPNSEDLIEGEDFRSADFNGDGRSEIWYLHGTDEYKMGKIISIDYDFSNNTVCTNEMFEDNAFAWNYWVFMGDFNGDGHTDFLTYFPSKRKWEIALCKTSGFKYNFYNVSDYLLDYDDPLFYGHYYHGNMADMEYFFDIADFDGDGKSDVIIRNDDEVHVYYAPVQFIDGVCYFQNEQRFSALDIGLGGQTQSYSLCLGNFLGKENVSILNGSTLFAIKPHSERYGVSDIVDGMGNKTEFQFDYLLPNPADPNDRSFYVKNEGDNYPELGIQPVALPLKGLKKVTTSNMYCDAPANSVVYRYENALVHRMGKGFLGFAGITATSYVGDVRQDSTVSHFSARPMWQFCSLTPEYEKVYNQGNALVSKTEYTYSKCCISMRKVFMPLLTKVEKYDYDVYGGFVGKTIAENTYWSDNGAGSTYYHRIVRKTNENTGVTDKETIHTYADCLYQTLQHTDYVNNDDFNNWVINRPEKVVSTAHQLNTGNPDMSSQTIYSYNAANPYLPTEVTTYPDGDERNEAGMATRKTFSYDAAGNVEDEILYAVDGSLEPRPMHYEYNNFRSPMHTRNGLGYETYTFYNAYGEIVKSTGYNDDTTFYWHDNRLGSTNWKQTPDNVYSCVATRWAVDRNGAPVQYAPQEPTAAYYTWSKSTDGGETRVFYDAAGRELRTVTQNIDGSMIFHDTDYDDMGRVSKVYDPYFNGGNKQFYTEYHYDAFNRKVKTVYPDGTYDTIQFMAEPGFTTVISKTYDNNDVPQRTLKKTNLLGQTVESTDNAGNTVFYYYYSDGSLKTAGLNPDVEITLKYDAAGNRSDLFDPNYGHVQDTYNAFGELKLSVSPKGDETEYEYDALGRMTERRETDNANGGDDFTSWTYCDTGNEKGLLKKIEFNGNKQVIDYFYDTIGRTASVVEILDGVKYETRYHYDPMTGRNDEISYPSGYTIKKHYHNGHLSDITDKKDRPLWHSEMKNAYGQITVYKVGNGVIDTLTYSDTTHLLLSQYAAVDGKIIQDFSYTYDDFRNLASRKENKYAAPLVETFRYDNLNRLEYISMNGIESKIGFDAYGRMRDKMADGRCVFHDAEYGDAVNGDRQRPHAIRYAELNPSYGVSSTQQSDITYTMFDKVKTLMQDRDCLEINYGYDHERISMEKRVYGDRPVSKTYVGNCEYVTKNGATAVLTYLSGPLGVFAVHESAGDVYKGDDDGDGKGGYSKLHYIFKDHLGSWTTITDEKGSIEREQSFDAWGKMRDPYTWREFPSGGTRPQGPMFDRGFTGHEHLFEFGLINMNGRMYDPVMSTFLSVDNYVQAPDYSQAFNRYAYCFNNPLKYTDPSGEIAVVDDIIIAALIGGTINAIIQGCTGNINSAGDFALAFGVGALSGAVGAWAGGAAFSAAAVGGFQGGFAAGLAGGAAGGFVGGAGNAWCTGASFGNGLIAGWNGAITGALIGGITGGLSRGILDYKNGYSFGDGTRISEFTLDMPNTAAPSACDYNGTVFAENNDDVLRYLVDDYYGIKVGDIDGFEYHDYNIGNLTTQSSGDYIVTDNLYYYNTVTHRYAAGYCKYSSVQSVPSEVHICPNRVVAAAYDPISFDATTGHELIHAFHHYAIPHMNSTYSEAVARSYTASVYHNVDYSKCVSVLSLINKYEGGNMLIYNFVPKEYWHIPINIR